MKEKIQHRVFILFILFLIVWGISLFLNNISFIPDFSIMDAISGATRRSHQSEDSADVISNWNYTREELALPENKSYTETVIVPRKAAYRILENDSQKIGTKADTKTATLLSNKENVSYQNAVQEVAAYLTDQGYDVRIKECSETMMLSMVHAGKFTFFLMDQEVAQ